MISTTLPFCKTVELILLSHLGPMSTPRGCDFRTIMNTTQHGAQQGTCYGKCLNRLCVDGQARDQAYLQLRMDKYLLYMQLRIYDRFLAAYEAESVMPGFDNAQFEDRCWVQWLNHVKQFAHMFDAWIQMVLNQDVFNLRLEANAKASIRTPSAARGRSIGYSQGNGSGASGRGGAASYNSGKGGKASAVQIREQAPSQDQLARDHAHAALTLGGMYDHLTPTRDNYSSQQSHSTGKTENRKRQWGK